MMAGLLFRPFLIFRFTVGVVSNTRDRGGERGNGTRWPIWICRNSPATNVIVSPHISGNKRPSSFHYGLRLKKKKKKKQ